MAACAGREVFAVEKIKPELLSFLKPTGALLTSFRNIRHWSVLASLMDGHYYSICARLFAKPEFQKSLLFCCSRKFWAKALSAAA